MAAVSLMQFLRDYLQATLMWVALGFVLLVGSVLVARAGELLLLRLTGGSDLMHPAPSGSPDPDLS